MPTDAPFSSVPTKDFSPLSVVHWAALRRTELSPGTSDGGKSTPFLLPTHRRGKQGGQLGAARDQAVVNMSHSESCWKSEGFRMVFSNDCKCSSQFERRQGRPVPLLWPRLVTAPCYKRVRYRWTGSFAPRHLPGWEGQQLTQHAYEISISYLLSTRCVEYTTIWKCSVNIRLIHNLTYVCCFPNLGSNCYNAAF